MADIQVSREFPVSKARLFEVVSTRAEVVQWWGHESWTMRDEALDFTCEGPWHSAMISEEGNLFRLSGQVTKVQPTDLIGFTWRWDAPPEMKSGDSHVTFTVQETAQGAKLIIDHKELATEEMAARHAQGWGGPLAQLERLIGGMDTISTEEREDG